MAYTITLHFTSGERTYPVLREGYKLNTLVGAKGKHATQGCQLNIRSHEASGLILQEQAPRIRAELKQDDTLIFQGVIRPYQSVGAKNATLESFSLEILDNTEVLTLTKITETATYSVKSLSWCIGHIYDMADIPEELAVPAALDSVMLPYFIVSPDQYDNVASFLSALLFEFGYDYRFSGDQCRIIPTSIDDASGLPQASLRNSFKISREDNWTDGVKVNYGIAEICSQIPLTQWKEDIADLQAWRYILPWSYSDSSGHVTRTVPYDPFFSYPESSKPAGFKTEYILSVMNARASAQHCSIISLNPNPRSVAIEFSWNIRQNYVWGNPIADWPYIMVYGDIVYAIPGTYQEQVEGEKPDEFTLTFLRNADGAKAFAQREYKRAKCAPTTYTFQSLVEHEAGSFYRISDSVTGVNVVVRILTCALDADGIYSITAESADYINIAVDPEDLKMRDVLDVAAPVTLVSDRDLINSGETVTVTASGRLMEIMQNQDPTAFIFAWTLNDEPVPAWDDLTEISTDFDGLEAGSNIIGFTVSRHEGDQIIQIGSAQRELTKVVEGKDGAGAEIEYALGDSIVDPPEGDMLWSDDPMTWGLDPMAWNNGEYTEDVPDMERGRYIWMRTRVGDKDWQYTRLTGSTSWDPENLGVCTTACPTTSHDGLGLIPGDYFVAGAQFVDPVDGNTYEAGWAYTYGGSGWTELSLTSADAARKASALLDSLTTAGIQIPASNSQYSVWLWAKNFVSQNAVIDNLFSQAITILSGGHIKGGDRYDASGNIVDWTKKGFWFGADGKLMASLQSDGDGNTYVGTGVGTGGATHGQYNTALGYEALYSNVSGGNNNIAIGYQAMRNSTTGSINTAIGYYAMYNNTTGIYNVAIGSDALFQNTTGEGNIALGWGALLTNSVGSRNVGIGGIGWSGTGWFQVSIMDVKYILEFKKERTYAEIVDVINGFLGTGVAVGASGQVDGQPIVGIRTQSGSLKIYYINTSGVIAEYVLGASDTTKFSKRTILEFFRPGSHPHYDQHDCID